MVAVAIIVMGFIMVAQYFWAEDDAIRKPIAVMGLVIIAMLMVVMLFRLDQLGSLVW